METPKSSTTANNNTKNKLFNPSSDSPAFQDSPVFNYISNLSPIQPVKAGSVAQGFPGLASPPLVFTSPLINSQTSFFNRKLQSSGSNSELPQDHEKPKLNEKHMDDSVKFDPEFPSPLVASVTKTCNTEKLLEVSLSNLSSAFDELLPDPGQCAKFSHETQSGNAPPPVEGGCFDKKDNGNGKDVGLDGSLVQKGKEVAQSKSRISFKLIKNEPRRLISSPECPSALPRLLTERNSEILQTGDSFSEATHLERVTLRRCLFDESQQKNTSVESGLWNPNASAQIPESASISTGKSVRRQVLNLCKPVGTFVSPVTENNPVIHSKPLGIGLHLNSVVYPRSTDNKVGSQQSSLVKIEGKSALFVTDNQSDENVDASNVIEKVLASSEEIDQHQACVVPTSDKTTASDILEQLNDTIEASLDACSTSTYDKNKLSSDLSEYNESDLVVLSPKKKRKKPSSSTDDETNKRCNCRKTKCLKLYCDCFAAGFYCGDSCACQGCFNRPEYEDTVLESRQKIESRNPLAFAPKVVQPVSGSPATVEEVKILSTPSSARHKRGCNCKKSMCQKKYCECYQENVGCSDGCRCEGCKNIYGTREDHIAREIMIKRASLEMSEGTIMVNNNLDSSRVHSSLKLTPTTPALQCSDQRKNVLQSRLPFRRFLQTPDSQHDMLTSGVNLSQNDGMLPEKIGSIDVGAFDTKKGSENMEDRLVPVNDESNYAPCSSQSSDAIAKNSDLRKIKQPQSFGENGPVPSSNSLRWRSSPITPITELATSELKDFDTGVKQSDMFEDETPEILKESYSPTKSVKVSSRSPNKKRISPPHNHMNSSESLRCSRKFVLRAVPSFPSLTPYSKNSSNDNKG